jgi:ABC-type glycerol-3-phosphate transport system substrate-binding protein
MERNFSRRKAISVAGKVAISAIVAGGVAAIGGYYAGQVAAAPAKVTETRTVTAAPATARETVTVTAPATTVTVTVAERSKLSLSHWTWNAKVMEKAFELSDALLRFNVEVPQESLTTGQVYDRLTVAATAGVGAPDWVLLENEFTPRFASIGILRDLEEFGARKYQDKLPKFWVDSGSFDGKIYGMPWDIGPCGIFYRVDLFEKYGLEPLKPGMTWDDVVEIGMQFLKSEGAKDHAFMSFPTNDRGPLTAIIQSRGGKIFEGKKVVLDSGEALEAIKFIASLRDKKVISMEPWWTDEWYAKIADGYFLCIPAGQWFGGFLRDWLAPKSVGLWRATSLPYWEKGKPTGGIYGGSNFCITTQTSDEKAERAWELIKFLTIDLNGVHALYKASGYFPANIEYLDMIKGSTEPYFGEQRWLEIFVDVLKYTPALEYGPLWTHYTGNIGALLDRLAAGEDPVTATKEIAQIIRSAIG